MELDESMQYRKHSRIGRHMKGFSLKMKQKILGLILLVIFMVMIASSFVVSYVTYHQNVAAVNTDLTTGAKMIKSEIADVNARIIQLDGLTTQITGEVSAVNQASVGMSENCSRINDDTGKMGSQTSKLDNLIDRFVI